MERSSLLDSFQGSGGCACKNVRFEIDGPIYGIGNCHCSMCRRIHGTAYATYVELDSSAVSWSKTKSNLTIRSSSEKAQRGFCSVCGSPISYTHHDFPGQIWIAAGVFDDDIPAQPQYHMFVGSKAPWFEITDDAPQHDTFPS